MITIWGIWNTYNVQRAVQAITSDPNMQLDVYVKDV